MKFIITFVIAVLCYSITSIPIKTAGIGRYKLHLNKKTWEDARVACLNEGAHLAVIRSAKEEELINEQITSNQLDEVWIGIHEQFKNEDWVTVQDERLDVLGYINWRDGEPNNFNNLSEHCVTITERGWNDLSCYVEKPFLCKL